MTEYIRGLRKRLEQSLPRDSLRSRFAFGAFWSLIGTVIAQGLALLASIVVARLLGKVVFGELGMILSTVGMFGVFAGLGMGLTATKYIAEFRTSDPVRAGRIVGMSSLVAMGSGGGLAVILLFISPFLAEKTINAPHLVTELRLGCGILLFNALMGAQTGALAGFEAFKSVAKVNLARGIITFPVIVIGVYYWDLIGAVAAHVVTAAAGWLLASLAVKIEARRANVAITYRNIRREMPILWRFSLPAVLSGAMVGPVTWAANTILANQPEGYGEIGLLSAATQWRTFILFLPSVLLRVAMPMMSSVLGKSESGAQYGRLISATQSLTVAIVFPLGVAVMFLSSYIIGLYGDAFLAGSTVLIGVMASIMIASIGSAAGSAIQAKGRMWFGLAINVSWGVGMLVFVWIFASSYGANAAAFGSAASYLIAAIWAFIYLAPDLPRGMLPRIFLALGFVVLIAAFCLALSLRMKLILAAPSVAATLVVTYFFLTDKNLWRMIIEQAKAWLGRDRENPVEKINGKETQDI